ncbi:DUF1801 domain-containing protein [Candidatus Roizmanbacteria bacterium]|nr:MAG: DUF1801 domain-containing protein [Candidatus Roizmanbacteria bacterium]
MIDNKYLAEEYKAKLPKANIGKSCIRFRKIEDIDLAVLEELIQKARGSLHQKLHLIIPEA